jgi:hypothetical protein
MKRRVRELGDGGVQAYLIKQVTKHGGTAEHFQVPGKVGPPDLIIYWPGPVVHFAETKAAGGKLEPWQERDHTRRRAMGFVVKVIWTKEQAADYALKYRLLALMA